MSQVVGMMGLANPWPRRPLDRDDDRTLMTEGEPGPPTNVTYELEEALELLAALEEARYTLRDTEHLAGVLTLEAQIQLLSRRLGFDDGGS